MGGPWWKDGRVDYEKVLDSEKSSSQRFERWTYMRQVLLIIKVICFIIFFRVAKITAPTSRPSFRHESVGLYVLTKNKEYTKPWTKQTVRNVIESLILKKEK